ncbi:MAG: TM1266 family iron-only hydrogenase system putative regulator [Acutalibacteraceae bacterium]
MDTRVAVISIIIESTDRIAQVNDLLHEYSAYVIGRMGIPYREKDINIICIAVDAPQDAINTLTGRLGKIEGISAKAAYSKAPEC